MAPGEVSKYMKNVVESSNKFGLNLFENTKLNSATEMFVEKTYKVEPSYVETANKFMDSETQLLDFKADYAEAEKLINAWVSTRTKQKINDLIPPETLNGDTRLVLVNAVHFKDDWMHPFAKGNTKRDDFHVSEAETIQVVTMCQTKRFGYLEKDDFKMLLLPYKDSNFSMVILLPKEIGGLKSLRDKLQSLNFNSLLDELNSCKVRVKIPKFKLEKFVDLTSVLSQTGLSRMFSDCADFSGIFEPSEEPVKVDKVLHKAFVEVNEEGTEAAAATAVTMRLCCAKPPEPIFEFYVDRPFVFFILFQNISLFTGNVGNFSASEMGSLPDPHPEHEPAQKRVRKINEKNTRG